MRENGLADRVVPSVERPDHSVVRKGREALRVPSCARQRAPRSFPFSSFILHHWSHSAERQRTPVPRLPSAALALPVPNLARSARVVSPHSFLPKVSSSHTPPLLPQPPSCVPDPYRSSPSATLPSNPTAAAVPDSTFYLLCGGAHLLSLACPVSSKVCGLMFFFFIRNSEQHCCLPSVQHVCKGMCTGTVGWVCVLKQPSGIFNSKLGGSGLGCTLFRSAAEGGVCSVVGSLTHRHFRRRSALSCADAWAFFHKQRSEWMKQWKKQKVRMLLSPLTDSGNHRF